MSIFGKSMRDYFLFVRAGLIVLLAVGVARFILGVSGVPYDRVTHLVSMSVVVLVLSVIYGQRVAALEFGGYRQLLVIVSLLSATMYGFIIWPFWPSWWMSRYLGYLRVSAASMDFSMRREQATHPHGDRTMSWL